ncbi:hypothetical protein BDQ12DRAFT_124728 [Crucibulum laeve]|uniref:Uncharacterized protein n=1 Tax=Crucibulum laeve TaxID=68775 RepID=A0A5C3M094_9AGAR|nr:hypothetical protein BDQ12DRAFT_124728 [Crucibulum laeve]
MPSFSKVFAIRKKPPQTKFAPAGIAAADWLANAITLVKVIQTASDLAPFPYIKSAAGTLLILLEPIQQLQKNRDDYKGLVQTTLEIIQLLQEEVLANPNVAAVSDRFKQQCKDVDSCLCTIVNDLNKIMSQSSTFLKQYWSSSSTCELIAKYQNEVNQLRSNLILRNTVATRGQIEKALHTLQKGSVIFSESNDAVEDVDISEFRHYKLGELELIERHVIETKNIEYEQHYSIKLQDTIGEKTAWIYRGKEGLKVKPSLRRIIVSLTRLSTGDRISAFFPNFGIVLAKPFILSAMALNNVQ